MVSVPNTRANEARHISELKELLHHIEGHVEANLDKYFKKVDLLWQPSDHAPDISSENELLTAHRNAARGVTLDQLIVLVGDTITEDALPTYSAWLKYIVGDWSGTNDNPFATTARRWIAEENRHGSLLDMHLRLDPRINMRKVEQTINYLIADGFDTKNEGPLQAFVYTSFQERATWKSHKNLGDQIGSNNPYITKTSNLVANDEKRHEEYYKTVLMKKLFEITPEVALAAYHDMMVRKIDMPAINLRDSEEAPQRNASNETTLFQQFSKVAQKIGVYTTRDYVSIIEHLNQHWGLAGLKLTGDTARAQQEYLLGLPELILKRFERIEDRLKKYTTPKFSWINYEKV